MGKIEPSRRSVPQVTTTTEDWLWFQLAMVDEEEEGGLRALADVLLGYGEHHFDGPQGSRRGAWAGVLLMSGQFERVEYVLLPLFYPADSLVLSRLSQHCGNTPRPKLKLFILELRWLIMVFYEYPHVQRHPT